MSYQTVYTTKDSKSQVSSFTLVNRRRIEQTLDFNPDVTVYEIFGTVEMRTNLWTDLIDERHLMVIFKFFTYMIKIILRTVRIIAAHTYISFDRIWRRSSERGQIDGSVGGPDEQFTLR